MSPYVLRIQDIDQTKHMVVGGKGGNLGELCQIAGINVPEGFCISAEAFRRIMEETPSINALVDQLSLLEVEDRDKICELNGEIRLRLEGISIPEEIRDEIASHLTRLGERNAFAVRSSATAEDLPTASFAGQHDTYLNVIGKDSILRHIRKCWASLFTDRAVTYRLKNGFDHRKVHMSVVVQKMVFPQAAGVLFTADPVTSNRKVLSIDAGFGLGEALVSGLVNADNYKLRNGRIIDKKIAAKNLAVYTSKQGGTKEHKTLPEEQNRQVLTDEQIMQLELIGRKIEKHFVCPQDIEWCLSDDRFYIVQSRPITALFPIPKANDQENHVFVSVGHQQMMTDPMKPLGMSFYLLTTPAPMRKAGGRLFVDITRHLASPDGGKMIIKTLGGSDPLIKDALMTIVKRKNFIKSSPDGEKVQSHINDHKVMSWGYLSRFEKNPAIVPDLIKHSQTSLQELKQNIQAKSGAELFDFIREDMSQLKEMMFTQSLELIMVAMYASSWINKRMMKWLGEKNAADTLSRSAPNNITSEMGLELLDVADVIRPYPEVIDYLQHVKDDNFLNELVKFDGGQVTRDAILSYLNKYGMRCVGEIDITRPRLSERPIILVPMILGNIKNFAPNASQQIFEQGRLKALQKEQELLERLQQLTNGKRKARETKRMIDLIRNLSGYREYPKYTMVNRYFVYKEALLKEAEQLVQAGVINEKEDMYYLTFEELHEVVRTHKLDYQIVSLRKEEYKLYERLSPPRVITSDGEIITGEYKREDLPAQALAGLPVSTGMAEGRARVILKMEDADLEEGDILVTSFTDPSWTPLFVSIKGLVTEVGGLMTHGAVIAREYGLPAVVGVDNATRLIKDGQRIRINGTEGYVEIL